MKNISLTLLTLALTVPFADITLAKPSTTEAKNTNNSKPRGTPVSEGVKFFFNGCTQITAQEKVVCIGTFRSISGERKIHMYREYYLGNTTITDTKGKSYIPDEIRVGGDYTCIKGNCGSLEMTLVEGVDYKTIFIFTDISLPAAKIPLLSIATNSDRQNYLKYRNIPVSTSGENSSLPNSGDYPSLSDADIPTDILNPKPKATAQEQPNTNSSSTAQPPKEQQGNGNDWMRGAAIILDSILNKK
jgi:hypothetical protein